MQKPKTSIQKNGRLLALLCLFFLKAAAQPSTKAVRFTTGNFFPEQNIASGSFHPDELKKARFDGQFCVLIQFERIPNERVRNEMLKNGIRLGDYLPENTYLAAISFRFNFSLARSFAITAIQPVPDRYKTESALFEPSAYRRKTGKELIALQFFPGLNTDSVRFRLQQAGVFPVPTKFDRSDLLFIEPVPGKITDLASLPCISGLSVQVLDDRTLNYATRGAHGIAALQSVRGKNLLGRGVTLGIGDNSDISTHIDFTGRLINRCPWIPENHGTHVAGTAAGAGLLNIKPTGMAPRATIVNQFFSDIITNAPAYITDYNMVVTNNSYYSSNSGCAGERKYDALSRFADLQQSQYTQLLHVIAAGNDGGLSCAPYPAGFGTIKSGWQCAKNVLTVGAINTADYTLASFSSKGPVEDGRIKPEITTNGWGLQSTTNNNTYAFNYGTSMASPVATGALALLYERYRQLNGGSNPSAALMKAILCNTATDLGNPGPDYSFGFGMLQATRAVDALENNRFISASLSQGSSNNHSITIPPNTLQAKIMLHWTDPAALANAASSLVNDLDITVSNSFSQSFLPLVLNPASANVGNPATAGRDRVNNIEQVVIPLPAAGNYTISVNGFSVPQGPQPYVITYDFIQPELVMEYPFGSETLVPGESENIRWRYAGNDNNTFTVSFSEDNGANWTVINSEVPAAARTIGWTVPSTLTGRALIRVSRNNTSQTGSSYPFSIIGSPVVTGASVCEGAVQLNWGAISGVAEYEIYQLVADSMKRIGTTASTGFVVTGLNKYSNAWFAVAAKTSTFTGRRSIAVSVKPNSGPCALALFNNDLRVDSILEPNTARRFFANAVQASRPVKISVKNYGTVAVAGPIPVFYSYNQTLVSETINSSIAPGATVTYVFTTPFPNNGNGYEYTFKSWVTVPADPNRLNDTAYKTVSLISNEPIASLPLTENFETMPAAEFSRKTTGIATDKRIDFNANTERGRARTFINTGIALSGNRSLTLDQRTYNDNSNTDSALLHYNLSNRQSQQLRFDFFYRNNGQENRPGNRIWIRGSENDNWIEAYDLNANQAGPGNWQKGFINLNEKLRSASPPQNFSSTFQLCIGQEGQTSTNSVFPDSELDDGYTFDDLLLNQAFNDIGIDQVLSPDANGCGLSANTPITIRLKNFHSNGLGNITAGYRINGGQAVTETIALLNAGETRDFTFASTADFSAYGKYSVSVWVNYSGDSYSSNDSILNFTLQSSPVISQYPYYEGFENNNGNYYTTGKNSSWEWGVPAKALISKAANGSKVWATGLTNNYANSESSYLVSPCFNLSSLSKPVLSFSHLFDIELDYDYTWVEYSTDGKTWNRLGNSGSGTNWYDNSTLNNWSISKTRWHVASIDLPQITGNVRFRFVLSSDLGVTQEGIGIDDIRIHEKSGIAVFPFAGAPVSRSVSGSDWVSFAQNNGTAAPLMLAEINPEGQNLGMVTVQYLPNLTGATRFSNNVYCLDRNFVIRSTIAPTAPVGLRLYFRDIESDSLINANSCSSCTRPVNAYELGVSTFSASNTSTENDNLGDNLFGTNRFINPASTEIMPHGEGYFAEFSSGNFGEYWLAPALLSAGNTNNCPRSAFVFKVDSSLGSTFQWQINTGSGYGNLSDDANYSGTASGELLVTNLPTSASGNRYRCLVDGVPRNENVLRFIQQWTGTAGTDWFNTANWGCGVLPDEFTDVVVPSGLANYPVLNASTSVRSLRINGSVNVRIAPGAVLQIKGR